MKKLLFSLLVLGIFACQNTENPSTSAAQETEKQGIALLTDNNPEWQNDQVRVYPIVADEATIAANAALAGLKTTGEAMKLDGFRITELKQFGRSQERTYNGLTVLNKSTEPIFLMSGDVVTGGNQDRVVAEDQVIAAKTIKNIDVFCIEKGRWSYYDAAAPESAKKVAAFRGYYNVASGEVRRAIQRTGSQQEVWAAVAKVTEANGASSSTGTYAALENESEQKAKREACLRFFDGKFAERNDVVGMIVTNGERILGVDLFGHPAIFQRQFKSLMHGYATDAVSSEATAGGSVSAETLQREFAKFAQIFADPNAKGHDTIGKFAFEGKPLHLYSK